MIRGRPPRISPLAASICPFIGADRSRRKAGGAFVSAWKGLSSGQIPLHARPAPLIPPANTADPTVSRIFSSFAPLPISFGRLLVVPCLRFYRLPIIACDFYNGQPPLMTVWSCLFGVYSDRGFDGLVRGWVSVNGARIKERWFVFGIFQIGADGMRGTSNYFYYP